MPRRLSSLGVVALLALTALPVGAGVPAASAQSGTTCAPGTEPDGTPDAAPTLSGPWCRADTLPNGDQDLVVWEVPEGDSTTRWIATLDGVPGTLTIVHVFPVEGDPAQPGSVGSRITEIASGVSATGPVIGDPLVLAPGRYLVGISRSDLPDGGSPTIVDYRFSLERATDPATAVEAQPDDDPTTLTTVTDAFALRGDLAGSDDLLRWTTLDPGRWDLIAETQLGEQVRMELTGPDGSPLESIGADGAAVLYDLELPAGELGIRISPNAQEPRPYWIRAVRSVADGDPEPNGEPAGAVALVDDSPVRGRLARDTDRDLYRLSVPIGDTAMRDIRLLWRSGAERRLCLLNDDLQPLVCRNGIGGASLEDLLLRPGEHLVEVSGTAAPDCTYLLRVDATSAPAPDHETEPNNDTETATTWDPSIVMQGRSESGDDDLYGLAVSGEPQLWQIEADGTSLEALRWVRSDGGSILAEAAVDAAGHALMTDLFLTPGTHWFRVDAGDGEYRLHATALGPPDPDRELEPNDDETTAEAYGIGERRIGRLATRRDQDLYRFTLAATEHVVLRVAVPADQITLALTQGTDSVAPLVRVAGGTVDWDLRLPPGEYLLRVRPEVPGPETYTLTTERADPFRWAVDQEPNDRPELAGPIPADLRITAAAITASDADWYALPPLIRDADVAIVASGGDAQVRLEDVEGTQLDLVRAEDGSMVAAAVPAGTELRLGVTAWGPYTAEVRSDGLTATPAVAPPGLDATLVAPVDVVTAYWPEAQRIDATVALRNAGAESVTVDLAAHATRLDWTVIPARPTVEIASGATVEVPVAIEVPPDTASRVPVRITLAATTPGAVVATAALDVTLDAEVPPVGAHPGSPLPPALLGGLDVASLGLGAEPGGTLDAKKERLLYDGVTPSGAAFSIPLRELPVELTVDLAGDSPLPVAGFIVDALSASGLRSEMPRDVELLLSTDGVTWTAAAAATLDARPGDQPFALPAPVLATHAMLRITAMHVAGATTLSFGALKIVASPGVAATPDPLDLADPAHGGHAIIGEPLNDDQAVNLGLLDAEVDAHVLAVEPGDRADWVIGFERGRSAWITDLEWVDPNGSDAERRLDAVEVSASAVGPLGPWTPLGTWTLTRAADGSVPPFALPDGTWARFVRLEGEPPKEATSLELPATIRVLEHPTDETYRSATAEWGPTFGAGPTPPGGPASTDAAPAAPADAGDTPDAASPLTLGVAVTDRAAIDVDVDWYAVTIPAGDTSLALRVEGTPIVGVRLTLLDASGVAVPMPFEVLPEGGVRYLAAVRGGETYRLGVEQPPFSAVFAFDTSISMSPYLDFVLQGLRSFADGVEPGREAVQVLPFEKDPLLETWSDDRYALMDAVNRFHLEGQGSSGAEAALIDASRLLAERDGARAILLITDAETTTFDQTGALWSALGSVRPVVFAVHLGATEDPVGSRHLMESWASAGGGDYRYVRTHADIEDAFERMAAWLRRPAAYTLEASTSVVSLEPGTLAVRAPADGSRPGLAPDVGVEIILDTSGSMRERIGRRTRMDIAKAALRTLVDEVLPPGIPVALRTFTSRGKGCGTTLAQPLAPLNPAGMRAIVDGLEAGRRSKTPLAASLRAVAADLAEATGPRSVVLITDGNETCGGDPEAVIAELVASGLDVHINIVGFALDDRRLAKRMAGWAALGHGTYQDASGAAALAGAIDAALGAPYRVIGPDGAIVAGGTVGGASLELAAGTYDLEVLTDPPVAFREVVVPPGGGIELTLDDAEVAEVGEKTAPDAP